MSIEQKQLDYALGNWDFEEAKSLLKSWSEMNISKLPVYCHFLADIGHLDKSNKVIESIIVDPYKNTLMNTNEFNVCKYLRKLHLQLNDKFFSNPDFFSRLYYYSMSNQLDLLYKLMKNKGSNINQNITSQENMIYNFAINRLIDSSYLDISMIKDIVKHVSIARNMHLKRKKYIIKKVFEYIVLNKELSEVFFDLNATPHVHTTLIPLIHSINSNERGAELLMGKAYASIKKFNDLKIYSEKNNPRVAICISGMIKSDISNFDSIISKLVKPLNADVFIHTWDRQQDWAGSMRAFNFWQRVFGISNNNVPKRLLDLSFLNSNYANIYRCLLSDVFSEVDKNKFYEVSKADNVIFENECLFLRNYEINEDFATRGGFNQVKMFYGIYRAFKMVVNKEINEGFQYDYIIRLRPDTFIKSSSLNYKDLYKLNNFSLAVSSGFGWGLADGMFYSNRSVYERIALLWEQILPSKNISPFEVFEGWDAHRLFGLWLVKQDIQPVDCRFSSSLVIGESVKVPNLLMALQTDCNKEAYTNFPEETEWLATFLADKAK